MENLSLNTNFTVPNNNAIASNLAIDNETKIIRDVLLLCEECREFISSWLTIDTRELLELKMRGEHYKYSKQIECPNDNSETAGKYENIVLNTVIRTLIQSSTSSDIDRLSRLFGKKIADCGQMCMMAALLINATLEKRLAALNYDKAYVDDFTIKLSILAGENDKDDYAVLKIDITNPKYVIDSYIIDVLCNETFKFEEASNFYQALDFPAYVRKDTHFSTVTSLTNFINDRYAIDQFVLTVKKFANIDLSHLGAANPFSYTRFISCEACLIAANDNPSNVSAMNSTAFSLRALREKQIISFSKRESAQLTTDIMNVINDCLNFCDRAIPRSYNRLMFALMKEKNIALSEESCSNFLYIITKNDSICKPIVDIVNSNRLFCNDIPNPLEKGSLSQIYTTIYNTLRSGCGESYEMMVFTYALLSLMLVKRLAAKNFNAQQINSLNLKFQPMAMGSFPDKKHFAIQFDFSINNEKHVFIIDPFIKKIIQLRNLVSTYNSFASDFLIYPINDCTTKRLIPNLYNNPLFLSSFKKIIESVYNIKISIDSNEDPFKDIILPHQDERTDFLENYQPLSPDAIL